MSQLVYDITAISRCGAQYRSDMLSPLGLKACHASYLAEIGANPGISQDKLAQALYINKSNVARQVAILEEDGFLLRKPSPCDKRVMELYLTEKSQTLMPQIQEILQQWERALTQDLTAQEVEVLACLLGKMKTRAGDWMEAH